MGPSTEVLGDKVLPGYCTPGPLRVQRAGFGAEVVNQGRSPANEGRKYMPSAATMAQAEEDVRDYNLTEEQKAIKAKYPPVNRKYECE